MSPVFAVFVILAVVAVVFVVFLILRAAMLWYWKIDESLAVLKEIRDLLAAQQKTQKRQSQPVNQTKTDRDASAAERASMSADELELERQALAMPRKD